MIQYYGFLLYFLVILYIPYVKNVITTVPTAVIKLVHHSCSSHRGAEVGGRVDVGVIGGVVVGEVGMV